MGCALQLGRIPLWWCLRVIVGRREAPLQQRFCRSQCCSLCFSLMRKEPSDQILVDKRVNTPGQKSPFPFVLWERGAVPAARPPKRPCEHFAKPNAGYFAVCHLLLLHTFSSWPRSSLPCIHGFSWHSCSIRMERQSGATSSKLEWKEDKIV